MPADFLSTLLAQLSQGSHNDLRVPKEMTTSLPKLVTLFHISFQFRPPQPPGTQLQLSTHATPPSNSREKPPTQSGLCQFTNQLLIQVSMPLASVAHLLMCITYLSCQYLLPACRHNSPASRHLPPGPTHLLTGITYLPRGPTHLLIGTTT